MPNRNSDMLFQLIKSLEKAEKRNFKLYIKRNSANEDLKIVSLFDAMDKMADYDEALLLRKLRTVGKPQLANSKQHLYKQLLASLRLLKTADSIDMQLNEQLDYARILYNKGLYHQSLRILDRLKELARQHFKANFLTQVIAWEKKIEALHITRSMLDRAEQLQAESSFVVARVDRVTQLSNLALQLYSWYIHHGHARNAQDEAGVKSFLRQRLPVSAHDFDGFYERLYLYQSYCWYSFIRQDFLQYYRYSRKWVEHFKQRPAMIKVETGFFIKGLHNLLNAHFDLRNYAGFDKALADFELFAQSDVVNKHDNHRIQSTIYIFSAKINRHFMLGTFSEGLKLVPELEGWLKQHAHYLDEHRIMVFQYKIANLYFGSGYYGKAIDYLHPIIHHPTELRTDLQCYARLLHLMAHYELQSESVIESLTRSVYRFMAKMKNFTGVDEAIFRFLRRTFHTPARQLSPYLKELLDEIKGLEKDRFQTRTLAYLDVISWVESKVYRKPLEQVIHAKYLASKHRHKK